MVTLEQFWTQVEKTGESLSSCWLWRGGITTGGYGYMYIGRLRKPAHRVAYELVKGSIPEGFQIDHLCRVRGCVRPDHLEAVTAAENNRRSLSRSAMAARRQSCANGHEYTDENTMRGPDGERKCRQCSRDYFARRRRARGVVPTLPRQRSAALTDEQALAIRALHIVGVTNKELATRFGVHKSTISGVITGRRYGALGAPSPDEAPR